MDIILRLWRMSGSASTGAAMVEMPCRREQSKVCDHQSVNKVDSERKHQRPSAKRRRWRTCTGKHIGGQVGK